jgi:hypothetical protein
LQDERGAERGGWRHWALFAVILAVALLLRIVSINREALWTDEALTLVLAHWPLGESALHPVDQSPFLYYALHQWLLPDGAAMSAAWVRSISLVAGVAAIPLMYAAGRLCLGRSAGLAAAAMLALWSPHVDYSQEARAYSLLFLLVLASATALLWWFDVTARTPDKKTGPFLSRRLALAAFALATCLSFYTHLISIFWIALALQILISAGQRGPARAYNREMLAALGFMALLALPGLFRFVREVTLPDAFHWLQQASAEEFASTAGAVLLPFGHGLLGAALRLAVPLALAAILFVYRREGRRAMSRNVAASAVVIALLALPLILWLIGFAIRPIFMPRTILYAIPGAILAILAVLSLAPKPLARAAFAAILLFLAIPIAMGGTVREKEDWRGAQAALANLVRPGDLIIACPSWRYPALRHAAPVLPAPVVLPHGATALLAEVRFGADPRWDRAFFDAVTAPVARSITGGPAGPPLQRRSLSLQRGASIWLVDSECTKEERAGIDVWLRGGGGWTEVWQAAASADHAGIAIRRRMLAAPFQAATPSAR